MQERKQREEEEVQGDRDGEGGRTHVRISRLLPQHETTLFVLDRAISHMPAWLCAQHSFGNIARAAVDEEDQEGRQ